MKWINRRSTQFVLSRLAVGYFALFVAGCATTSSSLYEPPKGGVVCPAKPPGIGTVLHYLSRLEKRLTPPPGFTAPPGANATEHSTLTLTVLSHGNGLAMTLRIDSDMATADDSLWYKPGGNYTTAEFNRDRDGCMKDKKLDRECLKAKGWVPVSPDRPAPGGPSTRIILSSRGMIERVEPLDTEQERKAAEFILRTLLTPLATTIGLARPGDQIPSRAEVLGVSVRGTVRLEKLAELEGRPVAEIIEDGFQEQAEARWQINGFAALWRNYRSHAQVTCDRKLGFLIKYRLASVVDTTTLGGVPGPLTASGRQENVREINLDWWTSRIVDE